MLVSDQHLNNGTTFNNLRFNACRNSAAILIEFCLKISARQLTCFRHCSSNAGPPVPDIYETSTFSICVTIANCSTTRLAFVPVICEYVLSFTTWLLIKVIYLLISLWLGLDGANSLVPGGR